MGLIFVFLGRSAAILTGFPAIIFTLAILVPSGIAWRFGLAIAGSAVTTAVIYSRALNPDAISLGFWTLLCFSMWAAAVTAIRGVVRVLRRAR